MLVDPITLEVLQNRFDVIADEMELTLLRTSFSPIVKEGQDASAALFTTDGLVVAQAAAIPIHLGCLVPAVKALIDAFPVEQMEEGDAYIMNDPYAGGTHLPDTTIVQPIVHGNRVVALAATMTHNQDIGGKAPGSIPTDATDIFQEGLCIPPLKLYERGEINRTLKAILVKNVRLPDVLMGDLHGQLAAGHVAIQRWREVVKEYGGELIDAAIALLMDRAEAVTRARIEAIPDGAYTFTDYLDNDGVVLDQPVGITVTVVIKGSDILFDFTGSSPQTKGPINSVASATVSGAYYVLRAITDPTVPNNSGCYRMVRFVLPPGSVVNPIHPAPVNARSATVIRVAHAIMGALAPAMPQKLIGADSGHLTMAFGGVDRRTGRAFVTSEMGGGGTGARATKDGIDVLDFGPVNCMNIPVEALEMDSPLRIRKFHSRSDSGGPGEFRGGLGAEKVFEVREGSVAVTLRGERFVTQPWGLFGGKAAASAEAWIERQGGSVEHILSKRVFTLEAGDRLHFLTPGGGGYGDPLKRDAEQVRIDVLDRKVSRAQAREAYGVVLADPDLAVDAAATRRRRRTLAARRLAAGHDEATPIFDHGRNGASNDGLISISPLPQHQGRPRAKPARRATPSIPARAAG